MPTYEYECRACGPFDAVRRIAERDEPASCPSCALPSERAWLTAPAFGSLPAATRQAHALNERSRHEPRQSSQHGAGCGCCSGGKPRKGAGFTQLLRNGDTVKGRTGGRPWMISH